MMSEDMILKVCGMREPENIAELRDLGADWIGFLFYDLSDRFVDKPVSLEWTTGMRRVGVFVDPSIELVAETIQNFQLEMVQMHGSETPNFCEDVSQLGVKVIKAFNLDNKFDFDITVSYESGVDYFLFDAKGDSLGGNGITFDWSILQRYRGNVPFILSGGIDLKHVAFLREFIHRSWAGIDINSRFETSPALKDIDKIKQFKHELFR